MLKRRPVILAVNERKGVGMNLLRSRFEDSLFPERDSKVKLGQRHSLENPTISVSFRVMCVCIASLLRVTLPEPEPEPEP